MGCGTSAGTSEEKDSVNTPSAGTTEEKGTVNTSGTGTSEDIAVDNTPTTVTSEKAEDPPSPREYFFKIILSGDLGVGKSSLLLQFTDDSFTKQQMSTIGITWKMRTLTLDGDKVELQLWDTAGMERFGTLNAEYYRGAQGIMVFYDITRQNSFHNVQQWMADVKRYCGNVGIVLVGNKTDLETDRVIDYNTAKEYADDLGIPFIETSAKDFINVNEAFTALATAVKKIEDSRGE